MEGEKRKILIVDDDGFLLDMYSFKFSQNNFDVFTAGDGLQAIEKLRGGFVPDILLIDIIMPEMDGFEALEAMKEEKLCPNTIKIILSNKNEQSNIDRGMALGVSGYIIKANSVPSEVIKKVMDILEAEEAKKKS